MQAKPCSSASASAAAIAAATPPQAEPRRRGDAGGEEGGHQHLALEADIDDAAALREQPAHGAEDQRRRHAQGRGRHRGRASDSAVVHHDAPERRTAPAARAAADCASAPENRITRPWITTTISRVISGIVEGELGAALLQRAEQQRRERDAERMVAAHQGHGDAGKAVAGREIEHDAVMHAHQLVDADEARQRAATGTSPAWSCGAGWCRHRSRPSGLWPMVRSA